MSKQAEPILDALIAIVSANLPVKLAAIATEYDDGIPLPAPATANYYFGERTSAGIKEYPALLFDAEDTGIDEFGNTWGIYDWRITVDVLLQSDDETVLARQLLRYARALWEVLFGNQVAVNGGQEQAISLRPVQGLRSPLVPRGRAFLKGWRWLCEVHRYDDLL